MSSGKSGAPQRRPLKPLSFYLHVFFLLRECIPRLTFRFPRTVLFLHPAVVFAHAYKQFLSFRMPEGGGEKQALATELSHLGKPRQFAKKKKTR